MPNGKLSDKYKGRPFGEIAKDIQSKYQDRYDPISKRGLMSEMEALKEQQEFQKAKIQAREQLAQALTQSQNPQQSQQGIGDPMQMQQGQQPMMGSNEGVAPEMMQQDPNMGHPASESYNQQFGYGGTMDYFDGGMFDTVTIGQSSGQESQIGGGPRQGESNNPLRYAPLAANLFGILSARKAPSTQSEMARMGYKTSIDETLGSQVSPRQTLFGNVDVSQLERGITNQARGFTGANLNASGGSGGQFIANELGNQSNVMNAIANARMQAQGQDRQTQAMNAQEQARIDQFMQGQAGQRQQAQAQNIGIGMQMADLDARNLGAFNSNRGAQIAGLATNLGNIGKEEDQMKMIANALGYTSFGNFFEGLSAEDKAKFLPSLLQMFNRG
jgi:hypothetical protein